MIPLISTGRSEPWKVGIIGSNRSEEHTSELQSRKDLVCRLLLEKKQIDALQRHLKGHCQTTAHTDEISHFFVCALLRVMYVVFSDFRRLCLFCFFFFLKSAAPREFSLVPPPTFPPP